MGVKQMIRTKDLTLEEAAKLLDDDVQDLGDLYRSKLINGDNELMIAFPKRLRMIPGKAHTPCAAYNDVSGELAAFLGGEYANSSASFIIGKCHPASEYDDNITTMEMVYSMKDATHALIFMEWSVDCPPADVSLDNAFGQRLKAVFCGRRDDDDDRPYGEDFWIIPLDALAPIRTYIEDKVGYGVTILEGAWREYDVRKAYYRQKIEEAIRDLGSIVDGIKFNFGADYLTATVPEKARDTVDDALDEPVWYNEDGLDRMKELGRPVPSGFGALFHGLPGGMLVVGIGS